MNRNVLYHPREFPVVALILSGRSLYGMGAALSGRLAN